MEKGTSEYANDWTSEYNLVHHYEKHGSKMGFKSISGYARSARNFVQNPPRGTKSFRGYDGTSYHYNPKTNEFARLNENGKIITYYGPETGNTYFEEQFDIWGDHYIN